MIFKYCGEYDWYENQTFTFLSTYFEADRRPSRVKIVVVSNQNGRIYEFETSDLIRVTKLEEALK